MSRVQKIELMTLEARMSTMDMCLIRVRYFWIGASFNDPSSSPLIRPTELDSFFLRYWTLHFSQKMERVPKHFALKSHV